MSSLLLSAALTAAAAAPAKPARSDAPARLGKAFAAYRGGDYATALRLAEGLPTALPRSADYALFVLAESAFYAGRYDRALGAFDELARKRTSRFADVAPYRAADCLWSDGRRAEAVARYRKALARTASFADVALARFRIAELAATAPRGKDEARRLFRQIFLDSPEHPLAAEAERRAEALMEGTPATGEKPAPAMSAADRLKRASKLSEDRGWQAALDELARLPAELTEAERAERDFVLGMTKYRMRRDYAGAATLLLAVVPALEGDKAATAAFHGARALSRADRDDEAIVEYLRVVERFPRSRWAAEAQFRAGWLDFNRGRFEAGLPRLRVTMDRFGKSEWATDAAWYVAFSAYLLGRHDEAKTALDEFERRARGPAGKGGIDALGRVRYFRARLAGKGGRTDEEKSELLELARKAPLSYYGLVARARLEGLGVKVPVELPSDARPAERPDAKTAAHEAIARADELLDAGLDVEAGLELQRAESAVLAKLGPDRALPVLFARYPQTQNWRRPYQLAESRDGGALELAPEGRARAFWEAAYPLAYKPLVERFGPPAGNPPHLLYAIMRKESGFSPHDVSYADARGLLQMIPPTSERVASARGRPFEPDMLYEPETNVELGAAYIGALHRKFKGQAPLTAGAYNAGPRAMQRWCDLHGKRPLDELVELVTYEQTREYIKRVSAIYARYRWLWAKDPWLPSLAVDCRYERGGPDY